MTTQVPYEKRHVPILAFQAKTLKDDGTFEAVVSSRMVDRDGEIVEPQAFKARIGTFLKNPVMLWNHNPYEPPIGKWDDVVIGEMSITARGRFRPDGESEIADNVRKAYAGGFLTAFSVGFRVFKFEEEKDQAGNPLPRRITDAELFEVSAVTIPANTDAMMKSFRTLAAAQFERGEKVEAFANIDDMAVLKRAKTITARLLDRLSEGRLLSAEEFQHLSDLTRAGLACTSRFDDDGRKAAEQLKEVARLLKAG